MTDIDSGIPSLPGEASLISYRDDFMRLSATRTDSQEIIVSRGVLSPHNRVLSDLLEGRRSLFVVTPSVDRFYGDALRQCIDSGLFNRDSKVVSLNSTEASKDLDAVGDLCNQFKHFGLGRNAPVVAMGGGVCLDISGLSAALYRRGVPNIKVPTTLIGLVDAGIGTKNAVNHRGHKSMLGTFSTPLASVLDSTFLATLPARHLRNGYAEMLKMAVIADHALFKILREHGRELIQGKFQGSHGLTDEVVMRSVGSMLQELSLNLYERSDYRRKVDFGHTFSPYIETASMHSILHGEAVAIDIALSTQLAWNLGLLNIADRDAILESLKAVSLPCLWEGIDVGGMYSSLRSIRQHRGGSLHLVVPDGIGSCVFIEDEDFDPRLLAACVDQLSKSDRR
ncbi:sedoheptulose 7-phosphate cyclase [Nocardia vinacea]|uniref:sedoheptulose 7-phosphate cyclase n=1 Tax=Nocardia vinacea TaxID=96468 RepID=UPI002E140E62|nr:sedoheptulose 7-phosphate cyclase [Nocardia vinacea]